MELKQVIQDLINGRSEQAEVAIHEYFVNKVKGITEAKDHLGDTEYNSWDAWKRACRKVCPTMTIVGDKDIGEAHDENDKSIGQWDGVKGTVYEYAKKPKTLKEAASKNMYQVKIESGSGGDWKDLELWADSLEDIVTSVTASPRDTDAHAKFDISQLTEIVEGWIGDGPDSDGKGWDEMDFDVKSHRDGVLKLSYHFSGVSMRKTRLKNNPEKYGEEVKKSGVITIMPGN
jgi:hypothetical protein